MASLGKIDTRSSGTPVRIALVIEAVATLASGIAVIARPDLLVAHLTDESNITPLSLLLTQIVGVLSLVFGALCILALPNTPHAIASRQPLYVVLGLGELAVLVLLAWHLAFYDEALEASQRPATREGLWKGVQQMGPMIVWRAFVVFFKPGWFGRWIQDSKTA